MAKVQKNMTLDVIEKLSRGTYKGKPCEILSTAHTLKDGACSLLARSHRIEKTIRSQSLSLDHSLVRSTLEVLLTVIVSYMKQ